MSADEELIARAKQRAEQSAIPEGWGYRVALREHESFSGRWRGETVDEENPDDDGNPRRIFLLWDDDDQPCFSRFYAALGREIGRLQPTVGCSIAIYRTEDYVGQKGTGYAFGVVTEPNDAPLPTAEDSTSEADDEAPF